MLLPGKTYVPRYQIYRSLRVLFSYAGDYVCGPIKAAEKPVCLVRQRGDGADIVYVVGCLLRGYNDSKKMRPFSQPAGQVLTTKKMVNQAISFRATHGGNPLTLGKSISSASGTGMLRIH